MLPRVLVCLLGLAPWPVMAVSFALRHVELIDGNGGAPLADATVWVEDGRIRALGPDGAVQLPPATRQLDLRGKTLLPGLVADHCHVGLIDGVTAGAANYRRDLIGQQLRRYQSYGVTTVNALGLNRPLFYALRADSQAGRLPGAELYGAGAGIGVPGAAPPLHWPAPDQLYRPATPAAARAAVAAMAAQRVDLIKIWVDDFLGTVHPKMSPAVYRAVIAAAHRRGLKVAAHVYYLSDAKALVAAGVDILAHGVRDRPVDQDLIAAMKARGTWYIPTLDLNASAYEYAEHPEWLQQPLLARGVAPALAKQLADPAWRAGILADREALAQNRRALQLNQQNLRALYQAGVKIGFGTDSGAAPLRIPGIAEHRELALLVRAGLSPLQAIGLATRSAAALLGLADRGRIAPGQRADFWVVDGDPSRNIAMLDRVEGVWQHGEQVAGPSVSGTP